jgi:hypothetical protein
MFFMLLFSPKDPLDAFEAYYYCLSTIEFLNGYLGFTDDLYIEDERFITSRLGWLADGICKVADFSRNFF